MRKGGNGERRYLTFYKIFLQNILNPLIVVNQFLAFFRTPSRCYMVDALWGLTLRAGGRTSATL